MLDAISITLFIFIGLFACGVYDYFKNKKTIPFSTVVYNEITDVGNVAFILLGLFAAILLKYVIKYL